MAKTSPAKRLKKSVKKKKKRVTLQPVTYRYNVPAMVQFFGSPIELKEAFKKYRMPPLSVHAVHKWLNRDSIPGFRILQLHTLAQCQHRKFNLTDYVLNDKAA